ncbi:MAG TPA: DUF4440 domain-containing protein [Bacteroidota bacterium]|nr:DUF4440 domain-containing protein [Bacteroidota bacterium]
MKSLTLLLVGLLFFSSCAPQKSRPTATREDIEKLASQFWAAHEKGDVESLATMVTEDVIVMVPNADDLRGRSAVKQAMSQMYAAMKVTDFAIQTREIDICDSTAYELATYTENLNFAGKPPQPVRGRYLLVWKRQPNQSWLVHRNLFNLAAGVHP